MNKKSSWKRSLLHYLGLWLTAFVVYFAFVEISSIGESEMISYGLTDFLLDGGTMAVFLAIALLFNHLFIRWFRPLEHYRSKLFLYAFLLLLTNTCAAIAMTQTLTLIWGELPREEYALMVNLLALVATFVSGIHANLSFQTDYQQQAEEKHLLEMENLRQREINLETSLMVLKTQVDPHFLFNNLSILSELIEENPHEAREFVESLSRVYRYKLVNMESHLVPLDNELQMLRSYIHLMTTRFGGSVQVVLPTSEETNNAKGRGVPPLAVQLLVENAIKHNAHSNSKPLIVSLRIENGSLVVSHPIQPLSSPVHSTGIGLSNLKERYRLLGQLEPIVERSETSFSVTLPLLSLRYESINS